jgi:hypothetical protein
VCSPREIDWPPHQQDRARNQVVHSPPSN